MYKKRMKLWISLCFLCMGLLCARLAQIQLFETESFTDRKINLLEASVKQRSQEMVIDDGRGNFLDRDGEPILYEKIPVLVLFPFLKNLDWPVDEVASIIGAEKAELEAALEKAEEPFAFREPRPFALTDRMMAEVNALEVPGVFAVEQKFPLSTGLAEQLLGIVGENPELLKSRYGDEPFQPRTLIGLTGLQKSFDEFLIGEDKSRLVYHVDGIGSPLFGLQVKYSEPANPFYPVDVKTTLDKDLQAIAERLADQHKLKKGGMVLLDIESNTIAAMVSRPKIDKSDPFGSGGAENIMTSHQIPGSIFKTVVAAAAMDNNLVPPDRIFDCSTKINGDPDDAYDHGNLDFSRSFSRSCNRTFADLARELQRKDPKMLETYAEKLSLLGKSGWEGDIYHSKGFRQFPDEDSGRVFSHDEARTDGNYAALSGIGQHEVRVTPLAVANMMATIARGGEKQMVRAVLSVEYQNGSKMAGFDQKKLGGESISPLTAQKLQKLLRGVVEDPQGTGRWFQSLPYTVAGKSGTAETGRLVDGEQVHSKWFAGYFPFEQPKYALVAVSLDVHEDEGGVNGLFADMVKEMHKMDKN